jgi:hypothetical protein
MRSSHSISAMVFSASIRSNHQPEAAGGQQAMAVILVSGFLGG